MLFGEWRNRQRAVKPDAEWPGDAKRGESRGVVAGEGVVGRVAGAADLAEELMNVARDALIAEAGEEFVLTLIGLAKDADQAGGGLREEFGELAKFQKTGIRGVGKVALGQHADPQELFVELL